MCVPLVAIRMSDIIVKEHPDKQEKAVEGNSNTSHQTFKNVHGHVPAVGRVLIIQP